MQLKELGLVVFFNVVRSICLRLDVGFIATKEVTENVYDILWKHLPHKMKT